MITDMQQKIEGLITSKVPYQDRHLICSLLQRNGRKISVMFYGGQSGGKKAKTTGLELGHMMEVTLSYSRGADLYRANSWTVKWDHKKIRYQYQAFSLLCFYLEIAQHISQDDNLHEDLGEGDPGPFRVVSNALFHMETALEKDQFSTKSELILFLSKLLFELGIFPQLENCCFSEQPLSELPELVLVSDQGGFSVPSMAGEELFDGRLGKKLWYFLARVKDQPYQQAWDIPQDHQMIPILWNYICYQLLWKKDQFKSFNSIL